MNGRRWDALTLGRLRRRRSMMRKLRALDRLDDAARRSVIPSNRQRRITSERKRAVTVVTVVVLICTGFWRFGVFGSWADSPGGSALSGSRSGDWPDRPSGAAGSPLGHAPKVNPDSGSHAYIAMQRGGDEPVTYDPCVPIHVVVNNRTAVADASQLLEEALREVEDATGLVFVIDGPTDEHPSPERLVRLKRYGKGWAPVLVSWSDAKETPILAGDVAGVGGSSRVGKGDQAWFVTGSVTLDGPQLRNLLRSTDGWAAARAVVMHEFGHVVGLAHVKAEGELMQPKGESGLTSWGLGDKAGLAALGSGDCVDY